MGTIKIGCAGWNFADWVRTAKTPDGIYPKGTRSSGFLSIYAQLFPSVEVHRSAKRVLSVKTLQRWHAATPESFQFSFVLWRKITHSKKLSDAVSHIKQWYKPLKVLEKKIGVILIELPSKVTVKDSKWVADLIAELPSKYQYAIEFQDPSWQTGSTLQLLKQNNIAWVSTYTPNKIQFLRYTGDFVYLRFQGSSNTYSSFGKVQGNPLPVFERMIEQIRASRQQGDTHIYIDNQLSGNAPGSCKILQQLLQV